MGRTKKEVDSVDKKNTSMNVVINKELYTQFRAIAMLQRLQVKELIHKYMENYVDEYQGKINVLFDKNNTLTDSKG